MKLKAWKNTASQCVASVACRDDVKTNSITVSGRHKRADGKADEVVSNDVLNGSASSSSNDAPGQRVLPDTITSITPVYNALPPAFLHLYQLNEGPVRIHGRTVNGVYILIPGFLVNPQNYR